MDRNAYLQSELQEDKKRSCKYFHLANIQFMKLKKVFVSLFNNLLRNLNMLISEYIEIDASKRFGKPILKGSRIAVSDILNWLANGMSISEIIRDFPELSENHIFACLLYASTREQQISFASWSCYFLTKIFLFGSRNFLSLPFQIPNIFQILAWSIKQIRKFGILPS